MIRTNNNHIIKLEALNLQDFCEHLQKNSFTEIYDLIRSLNLDEYKFIFYKAKYRFGDDIISNGNLQFCLKNGDTISIDDPLFPTNIAIDLLGTDELNHEPLGLITHNCAELYLEQDDVIINELLFQPGDFIGTPKNLDPSNRFRSSVLSHNLSAGSKSAFMLQSIKDTNIYNRISKDTGIDLYCPTSNYDHWKLFAQIAKHLNTPWHLEIIFFPRKFINMLVEQKFSSLYMYLNKLYVKNYTIKHNMFNMWQLLHFSRIEKNTVASKYNLNYIQAIKDIFLVCFGASAAFQPSNSDILGPFKMIKDFFSDVYALKKPIIMEPTFFEYSNQKQQPVYISIVHQHSMRQISDTLSRKTKISILQDILTLLDVYFLQMQKDPNLKNSELTAIIENVAVTCFHNSQDIKVFKNILLSPQIIVNDVRFGVEQSDYDLLSINTPTNFFVAGMLIQRK